MIPSIMNSCPILTYVQTRFHPSGLVRPQLLRVPSLHKRHSGTFAAPGPQVAGIVCALSSAAGSHVTSKSGGLISAAKGGPAAALGALGGGAQGNERQLARPATPDRDVAGEGVRDSPAGETSQANEEGTPVKRGRGRPKGYPSPNKGCRMSDEARQRMSTALKARWRDPEYRDTVRLKMLGKVPWNKGASLSDETRRKMSLVKRGRVPSAQSRKKMSDAAKGRRHTTETRARQSALMSGRPKTCEHRESIAATQRRRYAAARVLLAVEEVHMAALATSSGGAIPSGQTPLKLVQMTRKTGSRVGKPKTSYISVLETFMSELHEFRALKEELAPWTDAFRAQHGRLPQLKDVERTGIPWLMQKWKQYVILRGRVMADTQGLRAKLGGSPDVSSAGGVAANRLSSALQYKKRTSAPPLPAPSPATLRGEFEEGAWPSIPAAAAAAAEPEVPANAPPRLKNAMLAAMEYRKSQAHAVSSAAIAAAAVAAAPRSKPKPANQGAAVILRGRKPQARTDPAVIASPPLTSVADGDASPPGPTRVAEAVPSGVRAEGTPANVGTGAHAITQEGAPDQDVAFRFAFSGITTEAPDLARAELLEKLRAEAAARLRQQTGAAA